MHDSSIHATPLAGRTHSPGLHQGLGRVWRQLRRWWQLAEQRRALARLDERTLLDLGLSRADAIRESERPFWDDPLAAAQGTQQRAAGMACRRSDADGWSS